MFVYELEEDVLGYSHILPHRKDIKISDKVGEISCYVDFYYHGFGIAKKLIDHTIQSAKELGYTNLVATLLDCNRESIALLKKYDFEMLETLPNTTKLGNKYCSHLCYGLKL